MATIATNHSLRIAAVTRATRRLYPSRTSPCHATDRDVQNLRAAKRRCQRQVRSGRVSIGVGLTLGAAALVAQFWVTESLYRWMLLIAAAVEIGFVPWYTSLACRWLRHIIALIDLDLEEGVIGSGKGKVRTLLGAWPVLEDGTTGRLVPTRRVAFAGLRPGARVRYRFAARSQLVLTIEPEEPNTIGPRGHQDGRMTKHYQTEKRADAPESLISLFPEHFSAGNLSAIP